MNNKYYWAPSTKWHIENEKIHIEVFTYKDIVPELFPELYFLAQKGFYFNELKDTFPDIEESVLMKVLKDFTKKKILVDRVQTPKQLFHAQKTLFTNTYDEKLKIDKDALESFKKLQLSRSNKLAKGQTIPLNNSAEIPDFIKNRCSYRSFNKEEKLSFSTFSALLSVFKQCIKNNEISYFYASAGGLYPIDIYIHVKENRIDSLNEGLYYYNPTSNSLSLNNSSPQIDKKSHFFTNQPIHEDSAFTIFFIYNADVTMPKYDGMAYFYGIVDSGIMISSFTSFAEMNNVGVCSIGDMKFKLIEENFDLNKTQIFLHSLECGIKPL